jgi:hypothetical protein
MAVCDTCGNDYHRPLTVSQDGRTYTFDSLECAIQRLAPSCAHCGCRVIGHGLEFDEVVFCCSHCARAAGIHTLVDHA